MTTQPRLQSGDWYVVAGQGPMKLVGSYESVRHGVSLKLQTFGPGGRGGYYWAYPSQIVCRVTAEYLENFIADGMARMRQVGWEEPWFDEVREWLRGQD